MITSQTRMPGPLPLRRRQFSVQLVSATMSRANRLRCKSLSIGVPDTDEPWTPSVRLAETGSVLPLFCPSATRHSGPGFSVIELRNEPASGLLNANHDLGDLPIAKFVKAGSATYNFSVETTSVSAPRVRFLDLPRNGEFRAPNGMHVVQPNLDSVSLDLKPTAATRLNGYPTSCSIRYCVHS